MSKNTDNILLVLAILAVVVAAVGAATTYNSIVAYKENWFTGYATTTTNATVNLTVITSVAINFTNNNINFGAGRHDIGVDNATLITQPGTNNSGGNWTNVTRGFILENIGNVNVSIYIMTGKSAATFLGGTNPQYQYNVTPVTDAGLVNSPFGESCSQYNSTGQSVAQNMSQWLDVNNTFLGSVRGQEGTYTCANFSYQDADDELRIDLKLVVPSDAFTGALGDVMTASAYQSA